MPEHESHTPWWHGQAEAPAPRRRKSEEGGYALLFVLLVAAVIAISLYKEMPRVAFNTQRQKERPPAEARWRVWPLGDRLTREDERRLDQG